MALHATIVPDATVSAGSWTPTGAASLHAALADASDATYGVLLGATANDRVGVVSFGDIPALAAGEVITHLRVRYRAAMPVFVGGNLRIDLLVDGGSLGTAMGPLNPTVGEADYTLETIFGSAWTAARVNNLTAALVGWQTGETRVHRLWIEVHTNTPPDAIWLATDPSVVTTVSGPGEPYRNWGYFDDDGDPQVQVHAKLFEGGATVTDPETEVARLVSDTGVLDYAGTILGFGAWPNGAYMAAIKASDGIAFGPWSQRGITFDLPAPSTPLITAVPDPALNRYVITLDEQPLVNPTEFFQVTRSEDSGLTYRKVYGGDLVPYAGSPVTLSDFRSPRMARAYTPAMMAPVGYNEALNYNEEVGYNGAITAASVGPPNVVRYRARAGRVYNGVTIWSGWNTITPENLVGDGTMWLKHPTDPLGKSILLQQLANWETTSEEDMSILRSAHRQDFVVFAGVASWKRGELELIFSSDAAYEAFESLRAPKTTIPALGSSAGSISPAAPTSYLFQSCFGDTVLEQVWMRLGPTLSVTRVTTGPQQHTNQYRRVKIGFVETKIP